MATQANAALHFRPWGLALLRQGLAAAAALQRLPAADDDAEHWRAAVVDAHAGAASHTGAACVAVADHLVGDGFTAQQRL